VISLIRVSDFYEVDARRQDEFVACGFGVEGNAGEISIEGDWNVVITTSIKAVIAGAKSINQRYDSSCIVDGVISC
jgi:hypothetical protein